MTYPIEVAGLKRELPIWRIYLLWRRGADCGLRPGAFEAGARRQL